MMRFAAAAVFFVSAANASFSLDTGVVLDFKGLFSGISMHADNAEFAKAMLLGM